MFLVSGKTDRINWDQGRIRRYCAMLIRVVGDWGVEKFRVFSSFFSLVFLVCIVQWARDTTKLLCLLFHRCRFRIQQNMKLNANVANVLIAWSWNLLTYLDLSVVCRSARCRQTRRRREGWKLKCEKKTKEYLSSHIFTLWNNSTHSLSIHNEWKNLFLS